jgi:4-hydroxybenzoate polyprenyltransferase
MIWYRLRLTLEMIKFEHSVFALPFRPDGSAPRLSPEWLRCARDLAQLLWIVVAMVAARSAAMAFNRLIDAEIDARNPRTRMRAIPAGMLSRGSPGASRWRPPFCCSSPPTS